MHVLISTRFTYRLKLVALKVGNKVANEEWDESTKVNNLVHEESKDASNDEWITAFVHGLPESFDIVELLHAALRCDCYRGRVHCARLGRR